MGFTAKIRFDILRSQGELCLLPDLSLQKFSFESWAILVFLVHFHSHILHILSYISRLFLQFPGNANCL